MPSFVAENLRRIRQRVDESCRRVGRTGQEITLVAVTKTANPALVVEALENGVEHLGESRIQDASVKIPLVSTSPRGKPCWHMIGHLQSNKVNKAADLFDRIDSLDRWEIVEKLEQRLGILNKTMGALLEIKLSEEPGKSGLDPAHLPEILRRWQDIEHLKLRGLMTMAPLGQTPQRVRDCFARCKELLDSANASGILKQPLDILSMGMSDDFQIAIEEGSTEIRIGRAIFSPGKNA